MTRRLFSLLVAALITVDVMGLEPSSNGPRQTSAAAENETVRVGLLRPGGGYSIETMPIEAYVARVLAGEAARGSKPAALEALAITIRTFALANRGRHRADGFDLCDQTHCQVVRPATAATESAAANTAGRILVRDADDAAPAAVYYSASCGGRTEIPSAVWPGAEDPPFLPSQRDDACAGTPVWSAELRAEDLLHALRAAGFQGKRLKKLTVEARNGSGRVARLKVDGLEPEEISGQDLRVAVGRTLGWQHIKSTAFDLRRDGDAYRFTGHGSGHGVGLCVIGSARLAEQGSSAEAILARYFPGLPIGSVSGTATPARAVPDAAPPRSRAAPRSISAPPPPPSPPPLSISLPDGDEGERDAIQKLTLIARDDLAGRLGVAPPQTITLRFHATTDDYERATGQAWFTSGALVNGELHLLPLAVLRERGVLERTIRHELVHALTDATLGPRPAWVREGAAIYFAGERPMPASVRQWPPFRPTAPGSCPSDAELVRPVSVGALANAYARARACFAKQIEAGRSWREVH
jgi:stage II sporulation protein D